MADRKPSTVAAYLKAGKRDDDIGVKGGRGRRGPLGAWLLREKDAIVEGKRSAPALTWQEVSALAAADGIVRKRSGTPYPDYQVRKAWSDLAKARLVPRGQDDAVARGPQPSAGTRQVPDATVPPPRGQGGTGRAGGDQPPVQAPPATPNPVPPGKQAAGRAAEPPRLTATDMPRRRRFGDEE